MVVAGESWTRWTIIKSNVLDGAEFEAALPRSYSRESPNAFDLSMQDIDACDHSLVASLDRVIKPASLCGVALEADEPSGVAATWMRTRKRSRPGFRPRPKPGGGCSESILIISVHKLSIRDYVGPDLSQSVNGIYGRTSPEPSTWACISIRHELDQGVRHVEFDCHDMSEAWASRKYGSWATKA